MRKHLGLIVAVALVALSTSGCWLQLGGDASRTAFVGNETGLTSANASSLHKVWSKSVGNFGASIPVIDSGKVFVTGGSVITALAAVDGSQAWQVDTTFDQYAPTLQDPTIINGQVSVPYTVYSFGSAYLFDESTGANTSGAASQFHPALAAAVRNDVVAQDLGAISQAGVAVEIQYGGRTGFVYYAPLGGSGPSASPPMISGNYVFLSLNNTTLAFALDTCPPSPINGYCGATWTATLPANAGMPVALGTSQIAVPLSNGNVAVLDAASGTTQWTAVTGALYAQPPAIDATNIYVGTNDGEVRAFASAGCGNATCAPVWTSATAGGRISSQPVVAGGVVYVGASGGKLAGYAAANGASLYSATVDAGATTLNVVEDSASVYITTNTGTVAAYRAS